MPLMIIVGKLSIEISQDRARLGAAWLRGRDLARRIRAQQKLEQREARAVQEVHP